MKIPAVFIAILITMVYGLSAVGLSSSLDAAVTILMYVSPIYLTHMYMCYMISWRK